MSVNLNLQLQLVPACCGGTAVLSLIFASETAVKLNLKSSKVLIISKYFLRGRLIVRKGKKRLFD